MKKNIFYIVVFLFTLISCKKEEEIKQFIIKDFAEYNTNDYIIYPDSFSLDNHGDYIIFDLDGDNNADIRFSTYYNYQHVNNTMYFDFILYVSDLTTDSSLYFSSAQTDTFIAKPNAIGDEISDNLNWFNSLTWTAATIHYYGTNASGAFSYYWNQANPSHTYFVFRKKTSFGIKYGWVNINENIVGPFVMQR